MSKGKSLADFRAKHDRSVIVPGKIRAALADMAKDGADNWDYDADFIKRAGLSQSDIGAFREQFNDHIVVVGGTKNPKRIWVATAAAAKKFRATGAANGVSS